MEPLSPISPQDEAALQPAIVAQCSTLNEAQMIVSLLASFGIPASIDAENFHRMLGSVAHSSAGIRVRVRQLDAEAAIEIIETGPQVPLSTEEG